MEKRVVVALAGVGVLVALYLYWRQPRDYNDCVLQNMAGTTSNHAAGAIEQSCLAKFPQRPPVPHESRVLTGQESAALTGRADVVLKDPRRLPVFHRSDAMAEPPGFRESDDYYSGSLYNGNEHLTVVSIDIAVTTTLGGKTSSSIYTIPMTIAPRTVKDFRFNIIVGDVGSSYSWQLVSGKGF